MPIYVFACDACRIEHDEAVFPMDHVEPCPRCGEPMGKVPQMFHADAWGGPRYDRVLDKHFGSKDEWRRELRANGLEQAGDRVGGARSLLTEKPDAVRPEVKHQYARTEVAAD